MDTIQYIWEKCRLLKRMGSAAKLDAILEQLEQAENKFALGRQSNSLLMFNDVIQHTNAVLDGIVKEGYECLVQMDGEAFAADDMMRHVLEQEVFEPTAMAYLQSYLQRWRNQFVEDLKPDFNEPEAYLALSTVSAFLYVVVEQMILEAYVRQSVQNSALEAPTHLNDLRDVAEYLSGALTAVSRGDVPGTSMQSELGYRVVVAAILKHIEEVSRVCFEKAETLRTNDLSPSVIVRSAQRDVVITVKMRSTSSVQGLMQERTFPAMIRRHAHQLDASCGICVLIPSGHTQRLVFEVAVDEDVATICAVCA